MPAFIRLSFVILLFTALPGPCPAAAIEIENAWINEAPPSVKINAAYFSIRNTGHELITLQSISSPDFDRIEIHRSVVSGDRVKMHMYAELEIPAGAELQFSPGDFHLMLFSANKLMRAGESSVLTFYFSNGEEIAVPAVVKKLAPEHVHH